MRKMCKLTEQSEEFCVVTNFEFFSNGVKNIHHKSIETEYKMPYKSASFTMFMNNDFSFESFLRQSSMNLNPNYNGNVGL